MENTEIKHSAPEVKHQARILVVDDESEIRELLKRILLRKYHYIDLAVNAEDAIQCLQYQEYDLLLVDLKMPGVSGQQLVEQIRETGNKRIEIIVLTGHGSHREAMDMLNNFNISDFLNKPTNRTQLHFSVAKALNKQAMADQLRVQKVDLEQIVYARTRILTERNLELCEAKEYAEQLNRAKSDFLSHMSHELRTPMNAILGFGQILQLDSSSLTPLQQENIDEILLAGNHLLGLINEILDLSKIESGKLELVMEEISIDKVLQESLIFIKKQADERQLKIIDKITGQGRVIIGDITRFKQVILNLLSNAVKYNSTSGNITLDCQVFTNYVLDIGTDKQYLKINVKDTGDGISKTNIEKLFRPFERLNNKENVEGTGIGLVICKELVDIMGGKIGVESKLGKGSTFWVAFELVELKS